jgi:hypothetical protein
VNVMYIREGSVCDEGDDGEEERVGEGIGWRV